MTVVNPKSISGINSITTGSGSDNLLTIHTSDASSTERVRINSSGDVIVGSGITVSPDGDIFATGVCTATSFVGSGANLTGVASTENIRTNTNATFLQNVNVSGTSTIGGDVNIADKIVHTGDTNTAIRFPAADTITAETGGSERFRIDSSGNLSLGTSTSIQKFTIDGGGISLDNGWNTQWGANASRAYVQGEDANGNNRLLLGTNNAERVRIDSSGNIMFGTTSSTVYDDSSGYGVVIRGATGALDVMRNNDHPLLLNRTGGDGQMCMYHRDGVNKAASAIRSGHLCFDVPSGTEKIRFQSTGGISFNGDTSTDNALDDYEEGSWTPVVGGWDTATYYSGTSYYSGWYVKIGKVIHVGWKIYYQNLTTASSSNPHVRISGLPYSSYSVSAGPVGHVRFDIPEFGFEGYPLVYLAGSDSVLYMYKHVDGSNNLTAINATSNYSNNWTMGTATYRTA